MSTNVYFYNHLNVDETDKKILKSFKDEHIKLNSSMIAEELGMSVSTVWDRITKLRKKYDISIEFHIVGDKAPVEDSYEHCVVCKRNLQARSSKSSGYCGVCYKKISEERASNE